MEYPVLFLIRFDGIMTKGPNAGKTYTFANSDGGIRYDTIEEAQNKLAEYRSQEPHFKYRICSQQWKIVKRKTILEENIILEI